MKLKNFILSGVAIVSFGSCAPVPSYSVDSYIGSLNQCLNIEGTYENENYYRNYPNSFATMYIYFLPRLFIEREGDRVISSGEKIELGKKVFSKKAWFTFRILDSQRLEATFFNVEGEHLITVINMQKKKISPSWPAQSEEFTCNQVSWQRAYSEVFYGEASRKRREYSKTTKLADGMLKIEVKNDGWQGGYFPGLYMPDKGNVNRVGYFRKVDLTVDDIRAMNDKARRAIAQYDQLATSPPPQ